MKTHNLFRQSDPNAGTETQTVYDDVAKEIKRNVGKRS